MRNVWAFDPRPGSRDVCIWIADVREYDFILERGYAMIDGIRATPVLGPETCARAVGCRGESFLRLYLEREWSQQPALELAA